MIPDPPLESLDQSPVLQTLRNGPSAVSRKEGPWGAVGIGLGALVIGWVVFSSMSSHRLARAQPAPTPAPVQPAADTTAPAPQPQPEAAAPPQPPAPSPSPSSQEQAARWRAPAMVVDIADTSTAGLAGAEAPAQGAAQGAAPRALSQNAAGGNQAASNEAFAERVEGSSADTAHATRLSDTKLVAPQGTVIPAVLETAINSDLPGFVRAVVSRDVRGFDGSTVLIPRGSKLIGQYKSGVAVGQSRAFVVWSRVLTPEGVSVDIGSPGADRLGQGGLDGETNTHFFRRFGAAILLSVLSGGVDAAVNSGHSSNTDIVIGSPQQATNVAAIALQKDIDIPDTISVPQGAPIRVFVARDLDFSGVMSRAR
jgi:type IV secretion system protein VirB10